jgi:hypothetical protein
MPSSSTELFQPHETSNRFSDPFLLPSNSWYPTSLDSALDFSLYLYYLNPQYRQASKRICAHFVTELDFEGNVGDKAERDDLYDFLTEGVDLFGAMLEMGEEWSCYGNSFWRVHFPFDRLLVDDRNPDHPRELALELFQDSAKFILHEMKYEIPDPLTMHLPKSKRKRVKLAFRDRRSMDRNRIKLMKMDPRRISLEHSYLSGQTRVIYRFEEWFIRQIKDGRLHQVQDTPIEMLRAIQQNQDFRFHADEVYHFKAPTISGISNNGWGMPETMANYRSLHQLQIYRKIDEAIGMDYMLPFRLFSPQLNESSTDPIQLQNLGVWAGHVQQLIKNRRQDPFNMHAFPFPIQYEEFGAKGKEYLPKDLIEYQTNDMLDGMGYPAELFRGSLQVQQIPTTLRLFESTFHFMHRGFDRFAKWATRKIQRYVGEQYIIPNLQLPSMADDLEERHIYLQLAAGGEISRAKAYRPFGVDDPVAEAKERMQEDIDIQKEQLSMQAEFEREQTMGSADAVINAQMAQAQPGPGAPSQMTPLDIQSQGEQIAAELLQIQQDGERSKRLQEIQAQNPTLHAVVKENLEQMRGQAASMGRQQAGQMVAGGL